MKLQTPALVPAALLASMTAPGALAAPGTQVPVVSRTTPRAQDGLTLLALVRGDAQGQYRFPIPASLDFLTGPTGNGPAGGIGLWVRGVRPPPPQTINGRPEGPFGYGTPTAMGQGMGGTAIPVQCEPQGFNQPSTPGQTRPPLYLLTLPADYPTPYASPITVTMSDSSGHSARWQLDDLPPSYHAISGAVPLHSAFFKNGVALQAHAWRDAGPAGLPPGQNQGQWGGVRYQISGTVPARSRWLVRITHAQLEWDALTPAQEQGLRVPGYPNGFQSALCVVPLGGPPPDASPYPMPNTGGGMIQTPYADANRYLRLSGQLVRLATAQETVTFHNLNVRQQPDPDAPRTVFGPRHRPSPVYTPPLGYEISARPQTVVTPSGVSVTLLPFSTLPQNRGFFGSTGGAQMLLRFNAAAPGMMPVSLPRSPLARRYHKLITLTLSACSPLPLQQVFPIGGGGYPEGFPGQPVAPTEWVVTLMPVGRPRPVVKSFGGRRFTTLQMPPLPKYLSTLTLTLSQQADLHTFPVSFLVPVQRQAPPMPGMPRPRILPRRPQAHR